MSYTLRMPGNLRLLVESAAKQRSQSVASFVVGACWAQLERGSSSVVVAKADANGGLIPLPASKVDVAALRAICSGKLDYSAIARNADPMPLCPHKEWADDGEQYRCALAAGHKGKCRPGERV